MFGELLITGLILGFMYLLFTHEFPWDKERNEAERFKRETTPSLLEVQEAIQQDIAEEMERKQEKYFEEKERKQEIGELQNAKLNADLIAAEQETEEVLPPVPENNKWPLLTRMGEEEQWQEPWEFWKHDWDYTLQTEGAPTAIVNWWKANAWHKRIRNNTPEPWDMGKGLGDGQ